MKKLDWLNENLEYKKKHTYKNKIYEHKWKKTQQILENTTKEISQRTKNTEMEIAEIKLKLENQPKRSNIQLIPEKRVQKIKERKIKNIISENIPELSDISFSPWSSRHIRWKQPHQGHHYETSEHWEYWKKEVSEVTNRLYANVADISPTVKVKGNRAAFSKFWRKIISKLEIYT